MAKLGKAGKKNLKTSNSIMTVEIENAPDVAPQQTEAPAAPAPTVEEIKAKALKQVEFYFSDSNLPRDKFLLKEVQKSEDGWIPISLIATFARMKKITEDVRLIATALEESESLLQVNEEQTHVRRLSALPADAHQGDERIVYMVRGG